MMPATIEVVRVSASANSTPGTTFRHIATTHRWHQTIRSLGNETRRSAEMMSNVPAPSAQRMKATPKGVRKPNDNLMKRNEQPQTIPMAK